MTGCPPRYATPRTDRRTLGGAVAQVAERLKLPFMPWQREVVDTAFEVDDRGQLVYRTVVLTVPRQSGKSSLLLAVRVARAVLPYFRELSGPQLILHTAQTRLAARVKLVDEHKPRLEQTPFARFLSFRLSTGQEAVVYKHGSVDMVIASGEASGHGSVVDLGVIDEAFAQPDSRLETALRPAMLTRPSSQLWIVSTAGLPDGSPYLREKVLQGRKLAIDGVTDGVCYHEWSADPEADPGAVSTWRSAMPALGITQPLEAVTADWNATTDVDSFRRSHLNVWVELSARSSVWPAALWAELTARDARTSETPCFGFDVTPDRTMSSIAACSVFDGKPLLEIVDRRPGTSWVVNRLAELNARWKPNMVACDAAGPAGSLLADLSAAGVDARVLSHREYASACGLLFDAVNERAVQHTGDAALNDAVRDATTRQTGDVWLWDRRSSSADISPLVAATLAYWGNRQPGSGFKFFAY